MKSDSETNEVGLRKPKFQKQMIRQRETNEKVHAWVSHVLIQPSADTSTLQPYLANAYIVLSTYRRNLPRSLEHMFIFTRRQFKIATPSGKYMHILVN